MNRVPRQASVLTAAALGLLLSACGSGTKTVSVGSAPAPPQTQPTQPASSTAKRQPHPSPPPGTSGSQAGPHTPSAPDPAFTAQDRGSQGHSAATARLGARGSTP